MTREQVNRWLANDMLDKQGFGKSALMEILMKGWQGFNEMNAAMKKAAE